MKKVGSIMKEMGFREDAPDSVKEAFIKHLIKASTGADVKTPTERKKQQIKKLVFSSEGPEQLSFFHEKKEVI